jgi:aminoglycoside 6'-N-acetyltransferase
MSLLLRPATPADVSHLERWDHEPHVIVATSDDPDAEVAFEDAEWQDEISSDDPASAFFIAEVEGKPIGAMQVIDPALERSRYWGEDCPPNLRAMDIWIGEADYLDRGYGTQMMTVAINRAFADPSVEAIVIDPLNSNTNAHRFYQRLGFRPIGRRLFEDDDCLVHRLDRADWRLGDPDA